jgi:hypothetical protein
MASGFSFGSPINIFAPISKNRDPQDVAAGRFVKTLAASETEAQITKIRKVFFEEQI